MEIEKIRNTTPAELAQQLRATNDELFQLKFRMRMGQTESLKKIRQLRQDLARIKTVARERELGLGNVEKSVATKSAAPVAAAKAPAKKAIVKKSAAKKSAAKK